MATRSTIALEFADGTIGQVYAHWDGYLSHNGKILFENYSDPFKLQKLIDLGDVSSLGADIGVKHEFDNPNKFGTPEYMAWNEVKRGMCTFYGRDRNETGVEARYFKDYTDFLLNGQSEEYDYLLRNVNGVATWFVSLNGKVFILLSEAFAKEAETVDA
jgi:hypothetical protein